MTSLVLAGTGKIAVTVILVGYFADRSYPLPTAALIAGGGGGFQVAGRVIVTVLRRYVSQHRATAMLFAGQGLALTLPVMTIGTGASATATLSVVVIFGLGFGLPELLRGTLVVDYYGTAVYAQINGVLAAVIAAAVFALISALAVTLAHRARGLEQPPTQRPRATFSWPIGWSPAAVGQALRRSSTR